jgi:hypothetical protein
MEPQVSTMDDLDNFIEFLYNGLEGYVYVAAMKPNQPKTWTQSFLKYPEESTRIKATIRETTNVGEVYICPSLFKTAEGGGERGNFKVSNVVWADFDGNAPDWDNLISHPSMVIQSSAKENQHVYWKLQEPIYDVEVLENYNRRIQVAYGADGSCWPAVHVLRPPGTSNYKRDKHVQLVYSAEITYDVDVFDALPSIETEDLPQFELGEVPDLEDVILKYAFPPDLQLLLKRSKEEQQLASRCTS